MKIKKNSKRCCWWPTLGRAGPPATGSQFANLCVTKDHNWPWHQSVTSDIQGICDVWDFCEIYVSETILPSGGKRSWCSRPEWNAQSQPRGRACKNLNIGSRLKMTVRKNKRKCGCERCLMRRTDGIVALLEAKKGSSRTRSGALHPALHGVSYLCFKNTRALRPD